MRVFVIDMFCLILVAVGIAMVVKRPGASNGATLVQTGQKGSDPRVYLRRIAGTMLAAFGLALGLMVTLFHFLSAA